MKRCVLISNIYYYLHELLCDASSCLVVADSHVDIKTVTTLPVV